MAAGGRRRWLGELLALTGFALVQPLLDVTGRSPDFFLYRRASAGDVRWWLVAVAVLPALLLWAVVCGARAVRPAAAEVLHRVLLGGLLALVAVQAGKQLGVTGLPVVAVALAATVGAGWLVAQRPGVRQVLVYAAPAPVVFALLFAATTPSGALVRPGTGTAGARAAAANRPPVVFVFLDAFPLRALLDEGGEIDARLFPNFARLAAATTWYPDATGVTGWTPYAAPAMLSGRYPRRAVAASYVEYPENLFTLLSGTYDVRAYETISQLCPPSTCEQVPAGRPTGLAPLLRDSAGLVRELVSPYPSRSDPTEQFVEGGVESAREDAEGEAAPSPRFRFGDAHRGNQPARLTSFLETLAPAPRPALHFLHLLLPHAPWVQVPSGKRYVQPSRGWVPKRADETDPATFVDQPSLSKVAMQRLLLQTVYTDTLIGQLVDRMQETGLWDESLLVVTADHGDGLIAGAKMRLLDDRNAADLAWVPLFVKPPGQAAGGVDRRNAQHVDLLPTIADVLDVTVPWRMDGVSLLGPPRLEARKDWYDEPGEVLHLDPGPWRPVLARGMAPGLVRPDRGVRGLYTIGPHAALQGLAVSALDVGPPHAATAALDGRVDVENVDPAAATVPALLFGTLSEPVGGGSDWLVAAVNGRIAGSVPAVRGGDGRWRFFGVVDERYLVAGRNEVTLYAVTGRTLHPLRWRT